MGWVPRPPSPPRVVRRINTLPCAIPGLCRYHQDRDGFPHTADGRGGGQPPLARLPAMQLNPGVARGVVFNTCTGTSPTQLTARGGRQPAEQGGCQHLAEARGDASQPEVLVVWQGAPVRASTPRQPGSASTFRREDHFWLTVLLSKREAGSQLQRK